MKIIPEPVGEREYISITVIMLERGVNYEI